MSVLLKTAHAKASPRRFTGEPVTGFGELTQDQQLTRAKQEARARAVPHDFGAVLADCAEADADEAFAAEIAQRGSPRWQEVRDEEHAHQLAEERAERLERGL